MLHALEAQMRNVTFLEKWLERLNGFILAPYEACPKSIRLYFFPEKPVTAGWQI
jgi:hypothetical protein